MNPEILLFVQLVLVPMIGWILKSQVKTSERLASIETRLAHIERVIDPNVPIVHRSPQNIVKLKNFGNSPL